MTTQKTTRGRMVKFLLPALLGGITAGVDTKKTEILEQNVKGRTSIGIPWYLGKSRSMYKHRSNMNHVSKRTRLKHRKSA